MKLFKSALVAASLMVAASSCQIVKVSAPAGAGVELATESDNLATKIRKKEFYLLGGLVAISNNKTQEIIAANGFKKVRVETRYNLVDAIVNGITFGIIHLRTTDVYGSK